MVRYEQSLGSLEEKQHCNQIYSNKKIEINSFKKRWSNEIHIKRLINAGVQPWGSWNSKGDFELQENLFIIIRLDYEEIV